MQYIGYEIVLKQEMKAFEQERGYPEGKTHYFRWDIRELHPINIGRNLFGVASCMAFFKIIFQFEIHYKFGPILFCIKQVYQIFSVNVLILYNPSDAYRFAYIKYIFIGGVGYCSDCWTVSNHNVFLLCWPCLHFWALPWRRSKKILWIRANI